MLKRFFSALSLLVVAFAFGLLLPLGPFNRSVAESCVAHACCSGPFTHQDICGGDPHWRSYSHWGFTSHLCCGNFVIVCGNCNNGNPGDPDV